MLKQEMQQNLSLISDTLSTLSLSEINEAELQRWQELYNRLFNILIGRFIYIFPSPIMHMGINMHDDTYVWQFLAAMAVGANMEQQHVIVTEVRYISYSFF